MEQQNRIESFMEGMCIDAYRYFGAHFCFEGQAGVRFTVYAPHARKVYLIGDFTNWENDPILMEHTQYAGVYSIFVAGVKEYATYKYRIETRHHQILYKADPFAFYSELRPATASRVCQIEQFVANDQAWMAKRTRNFDRPLNIYEVYAGGFKQNEDGTYTYRQLQQELIPYVKQMGYTHIELLPLNEHPFDGSWGYQASGYFSVTSRYGTPQEFFDFVQACHENDIGVIMDIVPVHFVKDDHGLRYFDGEPLYEYEQEHDAHSQWDTMNFNFYREEVRSFLMSACAFWCDIYHCDGIRIDAVSNLIYWGGNKDRGTNEGSIAFMKRLNYFMHEYYPSVMMIAEDSSDYPNVTKSTLDHGLGFDYKWDLGWMNDTLKYFETDPIYRIYDHHKLTFSMAYFYSERFILPLSHDENVHGKKTIIDRCFGSYEDQFAQVRVLYAYMMTHPGKKLNFMGNEIASFREFDEKKPLDWFLLKYPMHDSFTRYIHDLNQMYLQYPCLYEKDYEQAGFQWIDADNAQQSLYSYYRMDDQNVLVCLFHLVDQSLQQVTIEVPLGGYYHEILNSQRDIYSGHGQINSKAIRAKKYKKANGQIVYQLKVDIHGFCAIVLAKKR